MPRLDDTTFCQEGTRGLLLTQWSSQQTAGQASQENPKWLENQGKKMNWGFLLWSGAGEGTRVNEEGLTVSFSASPERDKRQREKSDTEKILAKARWWSWALLDLVSARANLRRTNSMYPFREHVERTRFCIGQGWIGEVMQEVGVLVMGNLNTFTVLEL